MWTLVGGGRAKLGPTRRDMASLIPKGVAWEQTAVAGFDPGASVIDLSDGRSLSYDQLVVAPGIQLDFGKLPGLVEGIASGRVASNYRSDLDPDGRELVLLDKVTRGCSSRQPTWSRWTSRHDRCERYLQGCQRIDVPPVASRPAAHSLQRVGTISAVDLSSAIRDHIVGANEARRRDEFLGDQGMSPMTRPHQRTSRRPAERPNDEAGTKATRVRPSPMANRTPTSTSSEVTCEPPDGALPGPCGFFLEWPRSSLPPFGVVR